MPTPPAVADDGRMSQPEPTAVVAGAYDDVFAAVAEEFARNFAERGEVGASLCVIHEGRTVIDLWFDPASGTWLILNDKQENMPVEAAWCGIAGRAYETRMPIALDRSTCATPTPRVMACAASGGSLACR